jgi:uracil-DNA glycosylase
MVTAKLERKQFELPGESACERCPLHLTRRFVVLSEGNLNARIMFIGEAPGQNEDETGHPFLGRAGQNLDTLLKVAGIPREEVIIANMEACAPWRQAKQTGEWQIGKPKQKEIDQCAHWLDQKILNSKVEIVIPLGGYSLKKFLPGANISKVHGKVFEVEFTSKVPDLPEECPLTKKLLVMPMYHPAAPLHNPALRQTLVDDYAKIGEALNLLPSTPPHENYKLITIWDEIDEVDKEIKRAGRVCFDYETTGLDPHRDYVIGVAVSTRPGTGYYIPTFDAHFAASQIIKWLKRYLYNPAYEVIAFNADFEMRMTYKYTKRWPVHTWHDPMIQWYLLHSDVKDLKGLALRELNIKMTDIDELMVQIISDVNAKAEAKARAEYEAYIATLPEFEEVTLKSGKTKLKAVKKPKFKPPKKLTKGHIDMLEASRRDLWSVAKYAAADADMTLRLHLMGIDKVKEDGTWMSAEAQKLRMEPPLDVR